MYARKPRISFTDIHRARRKLQANIGLSQYDRKVLLDLIQDSERLVYQYVVPIGYKEARQSLHANNNLGDQERTALLDLIFKTKNKLYPSTMATDQYKYNLSIIERLHPLKDAVQHDEITGMIAEYESKFCV